MVFQQGGNTFLFSCPVAAVLRNAGRGDLRFFLQQVTMEEEDIGSTFPLLKLYFFISGIQEEKVMRISAT